MIIFKNTNQIKSHHQQQLTAHKGLLNALKNKIQSLLWPVALPDLTGACLLSSFPELLLHHPPFQAPSCLGPSWTSCFLSPAPVTLQVDSLIPVAPYWDPYIQGNCECRLSQSWKAEGNPSSLQSACKNRPLPSQVANLGSFLCPLHHHQSTEPGAQYYLVSQTFHHDFIEMPLLACSISPCIWVYFWTLFFCSFSSF